MRRHAPAKRGYAVILALMMLTLGSVFSAWLYSMLQGSIAVTSNEMASARAMTAAESGLSFMKTTLADAGLRTHIRPTTQAQALYNVGQTLVGMFPQGVVTGPGDTVNPVIQFGDITLNDGCSFSSRLELLPDKSGCRLSVTGVKGQATRTIGLLLLARPAANANWQDFPILARLDLGMDGHSTVWKWDGAASASSATPGVVTPFSSGGDSGNALCFEGQDPSGMVFPDKYLNDALYSKLEDMKGSDLKAFTGGNKQTNIYIPANTNPDFKNGVTLNGIVYVEWPNSISFGKNVQFNGVIIYQKMPANWAPANGKTWPVIDVSRVLSMVRDQATAEQAVRQAFTKSGEISTGVDELMGMISPWAVQASDTDWNPQEGNTDGTFDVTGSIHVRNFLKAAGDGNASPDDYVFHGSIVCEGSVDLRGSREFCIDPQSAPVSDDEVGIKFSVLNGGYWER